MPKRKSPEPEVAEIDQWDQRRQLFPNLTRSRSVLLRRQEGEICHRFEQDFLLFRHVVTVESGLTTVSQ